MIKILLLLLLLLPSLVMGFNIKSLSLLSSLSRSSLSRSSLSRSTSLSYNKRLSVYRLYCNANSNSKCKIVFLGTPDVAAESLQIFIDESKRSNLYDVVAVVTQPPAPAGRNKKLTPSPVQVLANSLNIPVFTPEKAKDPDFLQALTTISPDLCITAAYGNFLPSKFLSIPRLGTLNIHPSLLPKYRGAAPVQRCLENGDSKSGVSIVFTVLKMDAGPILRQIEVPLTGDEKASEFLLNMFKLGTKELLDALPSVLDGTAQSQLRQQIEEDATPADKLSTTEAIVDFSTMNARIIHNKMRGFSIWPGIWSTFQIGSETIRLKIISTKVLDEACNTSPDHVTQSVTLVKQNKIEMLKVVCGDGSSIGIIELQPPGKKIMNVRSFINGLRDQPIIWTKPDIANNNEAD